MKHLKPIAKGTVIVALGLLISKILTYFYRILLADRLGVEGYGAMMLGLSVIWLLLALITLGFHHGVQRFVSISLAMKTPEKARGALYSALLISLPLACIGAIKLFSASDIVSQVLVKDLSLQPILMVLSFALPFQIIGVIFQAYIEAHKKIEITAAIRYFIESFIQLAITGLFLAKGFGIAGAAAAYVVTIMISSFLLVISSRFLTPLSGRTKLIFVELIRFSFPLIFVVIFVNLMTWLDTLFLGILTSSYEVGLYNAAIPTANLLMVVPTAVMSLLMPTLSYLHAKKESQKYQQTLDYASRLNLIFIFPLALFLIMYSKKIIVLLFGESYATASTALILLATGLVIRSLSLPAQYSLEAKGKSRTIMYAMFAAVVCNLLFLILLIPQFGINGAAASTMLSMLVLTITYMLITRNYPKISLKMAAVFIMTVILSAAMVFFYIPQSLIGLIIAALVFGGTYLVFCFLSGLISKKDLDILRSR